MDSARPLRTPDAPTRVKISKADITTHEEIPGATLRVWTRTGNVVDEWVSEDTPHYIEAVLVAGKTYTLEETLVPDNSGYVPANAVQFTVEDDGEVQHVFMQDDYTKVQISKTDIATGKEISGAKLKSRTQTAKSLLNGSRTAHLTIWSASQWYVHPDRDDGSHRAGLCPRRERYL